jgi:lactoylglutathione lyase
MLSVASLQSSLVLYQQVLGGVPTYQFPDTGEPAFVTLKLGSSEIGLGQMNDTPPLHGQVLRPASGHRIELCVYVDELESVFAAAVASGAKPVLSPTAQPWGERVAYIEDPDGNLVMLTS